MKTSRIRVISAIMLMTAILLPLLIPPALQAQSEKIGLSISLMPWDYRNELKRGEEAQYYLEVRNYGEIDLHNIKFSADAPEGWTVTLDPGSLDILSSGSMNTIDVVITPPDNAEKSSYNILLSATADETKAVTNAYLNIESGPSYWLWVGIAAGVLAIIGFVIIFIRSNKE